MSKSTPESPLLIVHYHRDCNRALELALWINGYGAESARTIAAAWEMLRARRYALLLCCRELLEDENANFIEAAWAQHRTPSIMLTAGLTGQEMAACVSLPELPAVIGMPFGPAILLSSVRATIGPPPDEAQADPAARRCCPDCRGSGVITLLVRRVSCTRCGGSGQIPLDILDVPLHKARVLPVPIGRVLYRSGIRTLRQASRLTDAELDGLRGMPAGGMESVRETIHHADRSEAEAGKCHA